MYQTKPWYWPVLYFIDLLGYILVKPFVILKRFDETRIKKILVIRIDEIGDVILTTPVLRALKKRFPGASLTMLMKDQTKELLLTNPNVDNIIIARSWFKEKFSLRDFFQLINQLKKQKFDLTVELHTDPRNILLGFLASRYVIGFGYRGFGFLLDKKAHYRKKHIIEQNLDVVRLVGADADARLELFFSKKDEEKINAVVKEEKSKKLICINPGTGRKNKFWLNERWAALADILIGKYKASITFTGSKDEKELIAAIQKKMKHPSRDLTGKLALLELAALIKKCDLFLGPDTGPLHIARAVGTNLIGLFGPVDPNVWGYMEKKYRSIYKKTGRTEDIKVEDVLPVIGELL